MQRKNDCIGFLHYGNRMDLAENFEEWAKNNNIRICPLSVIAFLDRIGLINVDKALKYLKKKGENK